MADSSDSFVDALPSAKRGPTQAEVASHLVMSERNARDVLNNLGLTAKDTSLNEIREAYIKHLRAVASKHEGSDGKNLVDVRIKTEITTNRLRELELEEKLGTLVPMEETASALADIGRSMSNDVTSAGERIVEALVSRYSIELEDELIHEPLRDALRSIATRAKELVDGISGVH